MKIPRLRPWAAILLVILPALALPSPAQPNSPDYRWSLAANLSTTPGRATFPRIDWTADGAAVWGVWTDYSAGPGEILGRTREDGAGDWGPTVNLSADPRADEGAALYADRQGRLHLAWTNRASGAGTRLFYRQWAEGDWTPIATLDETTVYIPSVYSPFFCEDATGTLWLFLNLGSGIRTARLQENGWEPLDPWTYIAGMKGMGAIIAGDDGLFHVAARGKNEGNLGGPSDPFLDDAYYATTDGVAWSSLVNLAMTGTVSFDLGLAWDATGALHLFWSDIHPLDSVDSVQSAVYARVLREGVWSEREELTQPNPDKAVQDLAVRSDPAGRLHLVWSEGVFSGSAAVDLSIRYRRWDGQWGPEETAFTSTLPSLNVGLALDPWGQPAVVWEEGPGTDEEVYFSARQAVRPFRLFLPLVTRATSPKAPW